MGIGSLLLVLAIFILVGLYLAQPFGQRHGRGLGRQDAQLSALLAERDRVLQSLQELDFDHTLGKIPAEEYPRQRNALLQRGAAILKELDERGSDGPTSGRLQAAITPAAAVEADDKIESLIAARRAARKGKSGGFCPKCGKPVLSNDRFCPSCGKPL